MVDVACLFVAAAMILYLVFVRCDSVSASAWRTGHLLVGLSSGVLMLAVGAVAVLFVYFCRSVSPCPLVAGKPVSGLCCAAFPLSPVGPTYVAAVAVVRLVRGCLPSCRILVGVVWRHFVRPRVSLLCVASSSSRELVAPALPPQPAGGAPLLRPHPPLPCVPPSMRS